MSRRRADDSSRFSLGSCELPFMMRNRFSFVKDCVITITSDDYENFETIFEQTRKIGVLRGLEVTQTEVAEALQEAINERYVAAFMLSARPPHSIEVEYAPDRLSELWFLVTPRGKNAAKSIPELSGPEG